MKTINHLVLLTILLTTVLACKKDIDESVIEPIILACDSYNKEGTYVLENRGGGIDYTIDCKMAINGDLTIEPGVVIQFTNNAGLDIGNKGSLKAIGTGDKKIEFIGKDDQIGSWLGILFDSDDTKNELSYCKLKNAGGNSFNSNGDKGALIIWSDTKINVNNCEFINSAEYGINANYGNSNVSFTDNKISGCKMPMLINAEYVGSINGGTYTGNTTDVIHIATYSSRGTIHTAQTWTDLGVNYRVKTGGQIAIPDVHLELTEGITIEFEISTGISIGTDGGFAAKGTSSKPILFTGTVKQPGSWTHIAFKYTNSPLNEISNATIEYGGESSEKGVIYMWANPDLKLSNVNFKNIEACAIYDAPKPDYNPGSQVMNPNLVLQNITYDGVSNQNNSTTEPSNPSYCFGG